MSSFFIGIVTALWLGILTSISPCPLATNIAAISYIGKNVSSVHKILLSGLLYTIGRMLIYQLLGILIVLSILSIPRVSMFLQNDINKILGPILLIVGILLLDLIPITFSGPTISEKLQKRLGNSGIYGAGLLGIIFALAFCPISAALFFGSLIPLSLKHKSSFILPALYGVGTALPVIVFAFLLSFATQYVGKVFNKLTQVESWARKITGGLFLIIGIYYSLRFLLKII